MGERDIVDEDEDTLAAQLTPAIRRVLPGIRLYSSWLLPMVRILNGMAEDDFVGGAIRELWSTYARTIDLVMQAFSIWDLEDLPDLTYMLEEDADTLGFQPLMDDKTGKLWLDESTGAFRPRFSDLDVSRLSADVEMLHRVRKFMADGLDLANTDQAPVSLRGTRMVLGNDEHLFALPTRFREPQFITPPTAAAALSKPDRPRKPLSYAAAAANGGGKTFAKPAIPDEASSTSTRNRQADLSRMVDELVEDKDDNNPVTPPQHHALNPAVVTHGDTIYHGLPDAGHDFNLASYHNKTPNPQHLPQHSRPIAVAPTPPILRTPKDSLVANSMERLQAVHSLWHDAPAQPHPHPTSPSTFPAKPANGTLASPAYIGHSRVNSASSIRSRASQNIGDSWSSLESAPAAGADGYAKFSESGVASPLLFGAGGGLWSTGQGGAYRSHSPTNGQGG